MYERWLWGIVPAIADHTLTLEAFLLLLPCFDYTPDNGQVFMSNKSVHVHVHVGYSGTSSVCECVDSGMCLWESSCPGRWQSSPALSPPLPRPDLADGVPQTRDRGQSYPIYTVCAFLYTCVYYWLYKHEYSFNAYIQMYSIIVHVHVRVYTMYMYSTYSTLPYM